MGNMSYCRFENTARDLADCRNNLPQEELSESETKAFIKLVKLCREIAERYDLYSDEELSELAKEDTDY